MTADLLAALVPAAALIALGWGLRARRAVPDDFWPPAEWLSYYILLPALLIHGLATADLGALPVARMGAVLVGALLIVSAAVIAARPAMQVEDAGFTSVFQGAIRFNNYVGVMLATGLYGTQGTALAALCNAAIVPTVNVLSVLVFSRYLGAQAGAREVLRQVAGNPLVVACVIGGLLQATGAGLPAGLDGTLKALGQAALALGLLCVGAALDLRGLGGDLRAILWASAFKFGLLPAVTLGLCLALGLDGRAGLVAVMFHALPTATSSYILSRRMGGDARLMASITAAQTLIAAAAIPVAVLAAAMVL